MKIEGCAAIIVGGAAGIGKSFCDKMLHEGANVLVCDIQETLGHETAGELQDKYGKGRVDFRRCDGCSEEDLRASIEEALRRWKRIDVIVNHVGIVHETNWKRMIDINIGSAVVSCKLAEEYMGKNNGHRGGVLIHTASRAGIIPSHLLPIYSGTKAAMVQYTRAMMHPSHYKRHGIHMMCLCPGITRTPIIDLLDRARVGHLYEETMAAFEYKRKTNTMLDPDWVGDLLVTLVTRDEELKGVAAELNSREPVFHYKGEWDNVQ